jgi:hypothetical protein
LSPPPLVPYSSIFRTMVHQLSFQTLVGRYERARERLVDLEASQERMEERVRLLEASPQATFNLYPRGQ